MIALIIVSIFFVLLGIILLLLLSPMCMDLSFDTELKSKVTILGITISKTAPQDKENAAASEKTPEEVIKLPDNLFQKLKKKKGFVGAVKELADTVTGVVGRQKNILRHISMRKLTLNIAVAAENAADTAIHYGAVCTVVYPAISAVTHVMKIGMKSIDIHTDFEKDKPEIKFFVSVRAGLIFVLIARKRLLDEYQNFKIRNDL